MPNKKENPQLANPSPSLLRRILGGPMSEKTKRNWPELEAKWAGREIEMPRESTMTGRVRLMNILERAFNPDAYAKTTMFGNILLNRPEIEGHGQDLSDVLVHELAHIGQGKKGFLRKFYEPSKVEEEAINREAMRKVRRTDIPLYPEWKMNRK